MAKAKGKYYRVAVVTDDTPQTGSIAKIKSTSLFIDRSAR